MAKVKLEDLRYVGPEVHDAQEEVAEVVEEVIEEPVVAEEPKTEEVVADEFENAEPAKVEPSENRVVSVNKLHIYSIPSTKVPARSFTGNVVVVGHIDKFAVLEYVRAGFGKVKGYAIDSELPR